MINEQSAIAEQRLIYQVKRHQSEESFTTLYHRYSPLIKKFWRTQVSRYLSWEDWEQEAAVTLYKCLQSFEETGAHFAHYYLRTLEHRVTDFSRDCQRKHRIPAERVCSLEEASEVGDLPDHQPDLDSLLHYRACLRELINQLSPREQECFLLICQGYSLEATSHKLGPSLASVRGAVWRSRRKYQALREERGWRF